jgi:hypothetical protein
VNRKGISHSVGSGGSGPAGSSRESVSADRQSSAGIDVKSLDELTFMHELGAGASGTVRLAKHTSGALLAVKTIQILEKGRRDQMVSELRIMCRRAHVWG